MRIVCVGGGPAGLYFAIQMKRRDPSHRITVVERNRPYDTFGWGVVFSDETLRNLEGADPPSKQEILDSFAHWDDIDIHFKGRVITSGGHGFCGIERKHLLNILQHRAEDLGVELVFEREVDDVAEFADADLIVGADGINSKIRNRYAAHFKPTVARRAEPVRLARHASRVRRLHLHLRGNANGAGSRRTPIASTTTPPRSSSRPPTRTGAPPASTAWILPARSRSASACSRPGWTGIGCWRT